jgi:hypothetical protein
MDKYHDCGHRLRISDKRKRERKEVMPVDKHERDNPNLNSPANVISGGGATLDQVEIAKEIVTEFRAKSEAYPYVGYYSLKADAVEAILAEREELIKSKKRLDSIIDAWNAGAGFGLVQAIEKAMKGEG